MELLGVMTTDRHPTDDDLVLHYYGELGGPAARSVEGHLRECAACREGFARLERVMHAVDALPQPEPGEAFEGDVWARLRPGLRTSGPSPFLTMRKKVTAPLFRWAFAGGVAALVTIAFLAGALWRQIALRPDLSRAEPTVAAGHAAETNALRERLLLAAVGEHLERTEMALIELLNARAAGSLDMIDISGDQVRAEELLAMNRLYRQTAAGVGDQLVASMLDELERILTEVAGGSPAMTPADFDSMRRRIDGQNILFKVQVISSELRARERDAQARRSRMTS